MPVSHPENKAPVAELLRPLLIPGAKVLDCGIGHGQFGKLVRDIQKNVLLDGIEIFPDYLNQGQREIYDHITVGDLSKILPTIFSAYDAILLIDVVEHFERTDGEAVLRAAEQAGRVVIVSVPIVEVVQGPIYGNPHEEHKTQWKVAEMEALGYCAYFVGEVVGVFVKESK